ncbi:transposase [Streptomyces sp. NPDC053431]|uniref:transposase n=1 Tax=Streptomyces sp. NPDC053431 TaxID=3365703 RepID=UPI0037CF0B27
MERRVRHPGRKRPPDRLVFQGIVFVPHTGIAWEHLPQELGFGSGMTCWRRLTEWTEAGVWPRPREALLARLRGADALDFSRAVVDGSHIRALKGAPRPDEALLTGAETAASPSPDHRRHRHSACNHPDRRQPQRRHPVHPPPAGRPAGPGPSAAAPAADPRRCWATAATTTTSTGDSPGPWASNPSSPDAGSPTDQALGTDRWVVERTFAHLHWFRRLRIRWEVRDDIHEAFLSLACSLICWRRLKPFR